MIESVTAVLAQLGLTRPQQVPRFNVGITTGDTLWLDVFVDGRFRFHVKASEIVSLDAEFEAYQCAWTIFGEFMAKPLGYSVSDGWHVLVSEGLVYRAFPADAVAATRAHATLRALSRFLEVARAGTTANGPPERVHRALLEKLRESFASTPFAPIVDHWASEQGLRELCTLGVTPQHGDFVPNNLGIAESRLLVFDWEDFGRMSLPGLDLCTLVASAIDIDAKDAAELVAARGPVFQRLEPLLTAGCSVLGIEIGKFCRLIPLYLLAFLHLKRGYANEVRHRIAAKVLPFAAIDPHEAVM